MNQESKQEYREMELKDIEVSTGARNVNHLFIPFKHHFPIERLYDLLMAMAKR